MRNFFRRLLIPCVIFLVLTIIYRSSNRTDAQNSIKQYQLNSIAFSEQTPQGSKIVLTFAQSIPKFSIVSNNDTKVSIAFLQTIQGKSLKASYTINGLLKLAEFKNNDENLFLNLTSNTPVRITIDPSGNNQLTVGVMEVSNQDNKDKTKKNTSSFIDSIDEHIEVVILKYADVSEIVGSLTDVTVKANNNFNPQEPSFGGTPGLAGSGYQQIPQIPEPPNQPLAQAINENISIDRRLNAIILKGSPEIVAKLKAKIKKLDVPVDSVILETIFVQLTQTAAKQIGIDFQNNTTGQLSVFSLQKGVPINGIQGSTTVPTGNKYLRSFELQAAIYAQVQNGNGKILSKPRISALNGSTAKIITGSAIPIKSSNVTSNNIISNQVNYINVGVTLQIAPRITSDGFVTSQILCMVSSVDSYDSSGNPKITQNQATTSATVFNGDTFVIGGLSQENVNNSSTKIPVLGDLPVLGQLFRYDNDSSNKSDLYIVITPTIVKKGQTSNKFGVPKEEDIKNN